MVIISVSLSMLVVVAGMFLLAQTQKSKLGSFFSFVSYATITIGTLLVLASLIHGIRSHHMKHKWRGGHPQMHGDHDRDSDHWRKKRKRRKGQCCYDKGCNHGNAKTGEKRIVKKIIKTDDGKDKEVNIEVFVNTDED